MSRRTTFGALVVALLLLASAPAAAKGPTRLEILDPQAGTTTVLDDSKDEFDELMEMVGWPSRRSAPPGVDTGALDLVVTLTWTFDDKTPLWIDRVYADSSGDTWVQRRDFHGGNGTATWGRVTDGEVLPGLLTAAEDQGTPTTSPLRAPVAEPPEPADGTVASAAADGGLPLWAFGLLALPVVGLVLAFGWRRSLSAKQVTGR